MEKSTDQGKLVEKLAKALAAIEDDEAEPYVFSASEVEKLQAVIAFVDKMRALKWFGKWAMWFVVAAGTVIVNWERIKIFFSGGTP